MMISSLVVRNVNVKRRSLTVSLALTQQTQQQRHQQTRGFPSVSSSIIFDQKNGCTSSDNVDNSKNYNSNRIVHLRSTNITNGELFDRLQLYQQQDSRRLYSTTTVVCKRRSTGSSKKGDSKSKKKILKGDYATIVPEGEDSDDDDENFVIKTKSGLETLNYYNLSGDDTLKNDFMQKYTEDDLDKIIEEEEALMEAKIKEKNALYENWKPGQRRKRKQSTYNIDDFEYLNDDDYEDDDYDDEGNYIASPEKKLQNELQYQEKQKNTIREWRVQKDKRCGLVGIKVGMIPVYDTRHWGIRYPCTVLYIDNNTVLGHKTIEKHGYSAIQIAFGERKKKNIGKSVLGQYQHLFQFIDPKHQQHQQQEDNDIDYDEDVVEGEYESIDIPEESNEIATANNDIATTATNSSTGTSSGKIERKHPPYVVREFRITADIDNDCYIPVGTVLHASHFIPGQNIDIVGTSKGKGFQGGMKLHNFKGMPASHGTSLSHRAIGSVGQCQDPGRVFKGKKMPGRMGSNRVTIQNNRILKIDRGRNLIYVIGTVPGQKGSLVELRDSIKNPLWGRPDKVLDGIIRPPVPTSIYDTTIDGCGQPGYEVYMPIPSRDPLLPGTIDDDEVKSYNYQLKEPPALNES